MSGRNGSKSIFFLSVLLCLCISLPCCRADRDKTNVVLIVVDTLRADHLGCYGYGRGSTPHIDGLASESVLFKNAYSSSPWTTPSIASLLTSQHPAMLGYRVYSIELQEAFLTLAEIFKNNGYATGGVISNVFVSAKLGFDQGFDVFDEEPSWGLEGISSPTVTKKAVSFLKENKGKEFFLFLHYNDPHYNYHMHENYDYCPGYTGPLYSGQNIKSVRDHIPVLDEDDIGYLNAVYDSEISFTDEYIGKLIGTLKELGLYDDTLIVFTADHGEELAEREDSWIGHVIKVYQEAIRVPLLIRLPGGAAAKTVDDEVGLIDLLPTLTYRLKLKASADFDGIEIDLEMGQRRRKAPLVCETLREADKHSVVFQGWKYIFDREKNKKELYNLDEDPLELDNLAKKNRELTREYEKRLYDWNASVFEKRSRIQLQPKVPEFTDEQIEVLKSLGYIK